MLYFTIQNHLQDRTGKVSEAAGARWGFHGRIMVGLSSECVRIVFLLAEALQRVSVEILSFKISWQAQYLVRLEGDFTCSTHWKWRFICDADQGCDLFCVAGAVFAGFEGWLYLLCALRMTFHMWRRSLMTLILRGTRSMWWGWTVTFRGRRSTSSLRDILGDSRSAKCCILQYKIVSKIGPGRSPKRRVRDDEFMVGLWSDYRRNAFESSFHWRKQFRDSPLKCWPQNFVAGAVFGEVGGWLCLLRAL